MVARLPLNLRIGPMTVADIEQVHDIELASFPVPWPSYAFRQELESNRMAHYLVCRVGADLLAYGGVWLMVDEAHVTTFAVLPAWRRKGFGALLMLAIMDLSRDVGAREVTLVVIDGDQWQIVEPGQRARPRDAHQQGAGEAGTLGDRDRLDA